LNYVAVIALIFGAAFFLKLAFENEWIGEKVRILIGVLCGAFLELFRTIGTDPQPEEAERHARTLAVAAEQIDVDGAVERGKRLTADDAAALARDVLEAVSA